MKPVYYLNMAAGAAIRDDGRTYHLGAVAIRSDGALVSARNARTECPNRLAHAEYRVARKADVGAIVFVARVTRDGQWAMSRPCSNCQRAMKSRGVKKAYYTIAPEEYGVLNLV